jgi:hypothetical protein
LRRGDGDAAIRRRLNWHARRQRESRRERCGRRGRRAAGGKSRQQKDTQGSWRVLDDHALQAFLKSAGN